MCYSVNRLLKFYSDKKYSEHSIDSGMFIQPQHKGPEKLNNGHKSYMEGSPYGSYHLAQQKATPTSYYHANILYLFVSYVINNNKLYKVPFVQ